MACIIFAVCYYAWLRIRNGVNRNLILNKKYIKWLFDEAGCANTAILGDEEIPIEEVEFLEEDFKSEIRKIDRDAIETIKIRN